MKNRIIGIILLITLIFNTTACSKPEPELKRYEAEFLNLFDTVTQIKGYTKSKEEFSEFAQLIYDNLKRYHELYDIYNNYEGINNIKTINDNAGIKPVKVDQEIIDLLKLAKETYELTDGKMNVAFGSVLEVWHEYRTEGIEDPENASVPPLDLLKEKAKHIDINKMIINEKDSTVYLEDPEMSLDVGGIGKGYATEMVSQIAIKNGYKDGMISVGGNVRTFGSKGDKKEAWNVGIQNPDMDSENKNLYILSIKDMSLVTSGDYQRYYTVDGKKYHHIIDPNTLMPSDYFTAVTIVCENSGMADALTKAIYNMPYEEGLKFIEKFPDTEALWIFKDGTMKYSSHFDDYIKK
ncbi:thiamine biosynthesis lipoprotein [Mobilisporobacter senegalensis]|uniref:FAD:protein FMN transferase n=1 Tax=Mobilisporobacter senegalensis TaxID=1329262 RepID=A0A3N1XG84_9FIRM|nr:thiamine biosynthesis lipoprotein [Mobilisporobacter senegalensis]